MIQQPQRCVIDYELASNVFNIYRQLYNGCGAVALAKEFAYTSKLIIDNNIDTGKLFNECYNDMLWIHDNEVPIERECWLINTFDFLAPVVEKMKLYPTAWKLQQ